MDILLLLIFIISTILFIIGLINPAAFKWGNPDKRNRKKILKFYFSTVIVIYILYTSSGNLLQDILSDLEHMLLSNVEADNLEVHFIDVGQADSILVTIDGQAMLIDAGKNIDEDYVVDYIKSVGINSLNYLVGTHPHEDHIGGLDAVINSFDVEKVFMPKQKSNTKTFEDVLLSIKNKGLKIISPKVGATYDLGRAKWTIVAPTQQEYENTNNSSIVIKLEFGNNSFLFTGDAEVGSEKEMIEVGDLKVDVLKVGHHGSRTSTSIDFLEQVNPKYAVISVGADNKYGHPHENILKRLIKQNINVLRTDQLGTIIFMSDGNNLNYITNRNRIKSNDKEV